MKRKDLTLFILFGLLLLFAFSCDTTNPPSNKRITLEAEDASCTEAWLNLKTENISLPTEIIIKQNDSTIVTTNINSSDTTIFIENLRPSQTYSFHSIIQSTNQKSNSVSITTMDTTSHNFTWEIFAFKGGWTNQFNDVAVIDENNIWVVGEIHTAETDQWNADSTAWVQPYNAVHWDGSKWELKRIANSGYKRNVVFAFSENDIWFDGAIHWDGVKYSVHMNGFPLLPNGDGWRVNAMWGTSSKDFYVVGNGGNIAYYNGNSWTKIESGTELNISDLWGADDIGAEVYFVTGDANKKILKTTENNLIEEVPWNNTASIGTIWLLNKRFLFVAGEGIFRLKNDIWVKEKTDKNILAMDITGENYNSIVSACLNGNISYFNGKTWKTENLIEGNLISVSIKNNIVAAVGMTYNYENVIIIGKRN